MSSVPASEQRLFYLVCALLWLFLALIAYWTPIQLDDWFEAVWVKRHGLSPASVWEYASYNYLNYNPRLGETILLLIAGSHAIHVALTPSVELLLLFVVFALAHGRWPRPTRGDVHRLLLAQALLLLAIPTVGVLYFYRPYTANYLYGACIQLLLFLPYRFQLGRSDAVLRSPWWIPALFVAGVAAGMTNEHTGPTAMLALAALVVAIGRGRHRIRAWMIAGLTGLWIGYPMLFFAPGQTKRYGGAAMKGPLATALDRGVYGAMEIVSSLAWAAQLGIVLVLSAALIGLLSARRRRAELAGPDRGALRTAIGAVLPACAILATLLASPMLGGRLYLAPAALVTIAALSLVDCLFAESRARRFLVASSIAVIVYHAAVLAFVYHRAHDEFGRRLAAMEATPPGGIARVPPYTSRSESRWIFGDDFQTFTHRQYVANEYFGIAGIEFDEPVGWAEPRPPYQLEYVLTYDPPLAEAQWRAHTSLPTYAASYVEWVVAKLRRHMDELTSIPGHRLTRIDVHVRGLHIPELRGRPLRWLTWVDGVSTYPQGGGITDDRGMPLLLMVRPHVPPGLTEGYVHACGRTAAAPLQPHRRGLAMGWAPWCRGSQLGIACTPTDCWLGALTWR